jgi:diguanylate cyclase
MATDGGRAANQAAANAATPAQLAKGALRRLASAKLEPTPENYARAYADEAGSELPLLPERALPLLERLAARATEDTARRDELVAALMHGRWEQAAQGIERLGAGASAAAQAQGQAWATLIERLARGLERGGRQWTQARKKESLQRVLDGSRSDLQRLQQRLQPLVSAWEGDTPLAGAEDAPATDVSAEASPEASAEGREERAAPLAPAAKSTPVPVEVSGQAWPALAAALEFTVRTALPGSEPCGRDVADRWVALANLLGAEGATAPLVAEIDALCQIARRLFGHRHHLLDELGRLCHELSHGLSELAEDDSWARGQCEGLQARLAEGISVRSVKAASELLAETRVRHQRLHADRNAARDALRQLIHGMLQEVGELGEQTGLFHERIGRHAEAIARADSLESLAGVVREMVDESRAVQQRVGQTQARLQSEHAKASELEARVRELEADLRRLSEEVSTDALTQVANRRGLAQAFEAESARRSRESEGAPPLSVGLIDIDNFKRLNDTLGHAAGDVALRQLAAVVRERLRPADHLARFGGEEFVVLMPATPVAEAQQALTRLQRSLTASLFMHDQKEVFVTFSAGVTDWRPGEALETTLERADEALYEAKRTGKNRTCIG